MVGCIDVAIPGVIGLLLVTVPQIFVKRPDPDRLLLPRLRRIGMLLVGVALVYIILALAAPRTR